jgi:hypothetical protein
MPALMILGGAILSLVGLGLFFWAVIVSPLAHKYSHKRWTPRQTAYAMFLAFLALSSATALFYASGLLTWLLSK